MPVVNFFERDVNSTIINAFYSYTAMRVSYLCSVIENEARGEQRHGGNYGSGVEVITGTARR